MTDTLSMVREFHKAFDISVADQPQMPRPSSMTLKHLCHHTLRTEELASDLLLDARGDDSGLLMRLHLCMEELSELARAMVNRSPVAALDALADMRYVADGTILHLGFGDVFDDAMGEVHASNMSKLVDGKPVKNAAGRIIKPAGYFKPDLISLAYREST